MEVGKLVTSETCGSIFYFVVDDTYPDDPQPDASKYYYVVAPAESSFSYREAFCVLCRALCGLEQRTYLHRWHALYEQIFGTTPYVDFLHAVRDSPLVTPHNIANANTAASAAVDDVGSSADVLLPALFQDETTARLALNRAEKAELQRRRQQASGQAELLHRCTAAAPQHHTYMQHGCSTPIKPTVRRTVAPAAPLVKEANGARAVVANVDDPERGPSEQERQCDATLPGHKLDALLKLASQWHESVAASDEAEQRTTQQLQRELQKERRKRLAAEERCVTQSRQLEERITAAPAATTVPSAATAAAVPNRTDAALAAHKEETAQLQQRIRSLQEQLANEQQQRERERGDLLADLDRVKEQLLEQSHAQGAKIDGFLKENAGAVRRVEEAVHRREEELRSVYTKAIEERDVRIAQLSQEVLHHLQSARQVAASHAEQDRLRAQRVEHLEEVMAQLKEWNVSLQQQLAAAMEDARSLRRHAAAPASPPAAAGSSLSCAVCGGLPHTAAVELASRLHEAQQELHRAQREAQARAAELTRAAQLIEHLTRGVRQAKLDVDAYAAWMCPAA